MSLKSRETVSKRGMMRACERQGQQSAGLLRGVGVLLSEGGNTSAYLATERYRSMSFQPSACQCPTKLL